MFGPEGAGIGMAIIVTIAVFYGIAVLLNMAWMWWACGPDD